MFEKTSSLAEKLVTNVSRRRFLDSLGRWAGATALGVAGLLIAGGKVRAAGGVTCCIYVGEQQPKNVVLKAVCVPLGTPCPPPTGGFHFGLSTTVADCSLCKNKEL